MFTFPEPHAAASIILAMFMFYGFASGKIRTESVSLLTICLIAIGLFFFPMEGMKATDGLKLAFEGFGHYALITICSLMVLGRGLVVTGALDPAARALTKLWQFNRMLGLLLTLLMAFGLSMIINDTPVLVLIIPIMIQLAGSGGMPASKTLMPLNAAILLGGMSTAIGTSTNLLVVSIASDLGLPPMGVFHYTHIVALAALVALPYIWLVMPRLLDDNTKVALDKPREFTSLFRFSEDSAYIDKTLAEAIKNLPEGLKFKFPVDTPLKAGMRFVVTGTQKDLKEAQDLLGAYPAPKWRLDHVHNLAAKEEQDVMVTEMSVAADSRLIGLAVRTSGVETVAIIGANRAQQYRHSYQPADPNESIEEGDVLLVMGTREALQVFARNDGLLVLSGAKALPRSKKAGVALVIMFVSVALASLGWVPIAISSLGGAILMLMTGCIRFELIGRALSGHVIVLVASSIAIGKLILITGGAAWLGTLLASGLQHLPVFGVLAAIMLFVTTLTNFASNATAAAVGTPIAFSIAKQLGLPVEPLVLAVLFGCNLCYATPIAYQTNLLIMGVGNYDFKDYAKTGIPLILLMIVTLSSLLVYFYKL